jgi:hypothetical protein
MAGILETVEGVATYVFNIMGRNANILACGAEISCVAKHHQLYLASQNKCDK